MTRFRTLLAAGLALLVAGLAVPASAAPKTTCPERVLIIAAMPLELNPFFEKMQWSGNQVRDNRTFYVGKLAGSDVAIAMSGIGPVNATQTAKAGLSLPGCRFRAVLFSGVAGSTGNIGDVAVPRRWTIDEGKHWRSVDQRMLSVARRLDEASLGLTQDVPVGDAACVCPGVDAATPVHLPTPVRLRVGGDGATTDPFNGRAVPCVPGGGDIAGCEPCLTMPGTVNNAATFASHVPEYPDVLQGVFSGQASSSMQVDAVDEETAAVHAVAAAHKVPFLGFRGVSDGKGDPLGLPGFPVQFAYYRQLAADNAAATTIGFLKTWKAEGRPVA
jgi:nucleoside phosphorylase